MKQRLLLVILTALAVIGLTLLGNWLVRCFTLDIQTEAEMPLPVQAESGILFIPQKRTSKTPLVCHHTRPKPKIPCHTGCPSCR